MTEKGKTLEELIATRNELDKLIRELSSNSELSAVAECVEDDIEEDEYDDWEEDGVDVEQDDYGYHIRCHQSFPSVPIVIHGNPHLEFNSCINIDLSNHVDNSVKRHSTNNINCGVGDSALQAIGGLIGKLFLD